MQSSGPSGQSDMSLRVLFLAVLSQGVLIVPAQAQPELPASVCPPLTVTSANIVGLFSIAENPQIESVRVIYKTDAGQNQVNLKLLRRDAKLLKQRVSALLSNEEDRPIRFERERLADGGCFTRLADEVPQ